LENQSANKPNHPSDTDGSVNQQSRITSKIKSNPLNSQYVGVNLPDHTVNFIYSWGILIQMTIDEGSMDRTIIKNILARGIIGIRDWEREKLQDILINIDLYTEIRKPEAPDDISECIDYSEVAKKVMRHAETAKRFTLEALAEDIALMCLQDNRVLKTTVRVEKPGAVRFSESVGVEITRSRNSI